MQVHKLGPSRFWNGRVLVQVRDRAGKESMRLEPRQDVDVVLPRDKFEAEVGWAKEPARDSRHAEMRSLRGRRHSSQSKQLMSTGL